MVSNLTINHLRQKRHTAHLVQWTLAVQTPIRNAIYVHEHNLIKMSRKSKQLIIILTMQKYFKVKKMLFKRTDQALSKLAFS